MNAIFLQWIKDGLPSTFVPTPSNQMFFNQSFFNHLKSNKMESTISGGYTPFSKDISKENLALFDAAVGNLLGATYTPLAVSTQVVAGENYRFFCNAVKSVAPPTNEGAIVSFYVPIGGKPQDVKVKTTT